MSHFFLLVFFVSSLAVGIIILALAVATVLSYRPYNSFYVPINKAIMDEKAVMGFSYAQMVYIVNVMTDLEREIERPWWARFIRYPKDQLDMNREIVEQLIPRLQLLEATHK